MIKKKKIRILNTNSYVVDTLLIFTIMIVMENINSKKGIFASLGYITSEDAMRVFEEQIVSEANESDMYVPKMVEDDDAGFSEWFQNSRELAKVKFSKMKNL